MEKHNKELYALLQMYNSDSVSDNSEVILAPQKKKKLTKHRRRPDNSRGGEQLSRQLCGGRTISLTLGLSLLLCWLLTLSWLAVVLNSQIQHLDATVQRVVAGSQGVPETLQKCHTMSKQLQQNQTALFLKLNLLTAQLNNFTSQVTVISNSLNRVEQRFKTSPELIKVPHDLETLTTNIATFGSQMQDLVSTVAQLKDANTKLSESNKLLQTNVTNIKQELTNLSVPVVSSPLAGVDAVIQSINASVNAVRANLSLVNDTLSKKVQWAQDDQTNQYKQIVSLLERNENVSTRVTSLQNECSAKELQLTTLATSVSQLTSQVTKQEDHWTQVTSKVNELSTVCHELVTNSSLLGAELATIKKTVGSDTVSPLNLTSIFTSSTASSAGVNDSLRES